MATSSIRAAAAASREHHLGLDPGRAADSSAAGTQSKSRTGSTSSRRNSSPPRDVDTLPALKPNFTSTPVGGGGDGGARRRSRSHSGNSVTFQGAQPSRPGHLDLAGGGGHSSGVVMANPDEIIILEGDSSLASSTSCSSTNVASGPGDVRFVHPAKEVHVQAPIVGYEIMEERARFTVRTVVPNLAPWKWVVNLETPAHDSW